MLTGLRVRLNLLADFRWLQREPGRVIEVDGDRGRAVREAEAGGGEARPRHRGVTADAERDLYGKIGKKDPTGSTSLSFSFKTFLKASS